MWIDFATFLKKSSAKNFSRFAVNYLCDLKKQASAPSSGRSWHASGVTEEGSRGDCRGGNLPPALLALP